MGLTGRISVSTEMLRAQSEQVRQALSDMQSELAGYETFINSIGNYWLGESADTFRTVFNSQKTLISEMIQRYTEHVQDLEMLGKIWDDTDSDNLKLLEGLSIPEL